jgi:hypothetical protein
MGIANEPLGVKLFFAIMYQSEFNLDAIIRMIDEKFGPREFEYGPIPFSWSEYYASEMGENLLKVYISYEKMIDRSLLPGIKILTNEIESQYAVANQRRINIDPGYIARDKVVLATTKDFYHRLYLSHGIYGEVTLHYKRGRYRFFSWTYPDYRQPQAYQFFEKSRAKLVKEVRRIDAIDE